jgi:hypothetical protein
MPIHPNEGQNIQPVATIRMTSVISEKRISVNIYLCCEFMERSGPRIRANRKDQKVLLSLLRKVRTEAGLRQVDMAEALQLPQSFVSKYESGERRLDPLELYAVCHAAGITFAQFASRFEKIIG